MKNNRIRGNYFFYLGAFLLPCVAYAHADMNQEIQAAVSTILKKHGNPSFTCILSSDERLRANHTDILELAQLKEQISVEKEVLSKLRNQMEIIKASLESIQALFVKIQTETSQTTELLKEVNQ